MGNEKEVPPVGETAFGTEGKRTAPRSSTIADDEFFRALAARPRRRLLAYLLEHETATRDDLAAVLVGWETTDTGEGAATEDYNRMRTSLRHTHLPMLDDAGLVTYDPTNDEVTLRDIDEYAAEILRFSIAVEQD